MITSFASGHRLLKCIIEICKPAPPNAMKPNPTTNPSKSVGSSVIPDENSWRRILVPEVENPNKRVPTAKNRQPTEPHTFGPKRSNTTPITKSPLRLEYWREEKKRRRNTTNKQTVPAVKIVVKRSVCSPHYLNSLTRISKRGYLLLCWYLQDNIGSIFPPFARWIPVKAILNIPVN